MEKELLFRSLRQKGFSDKIVLAFEKINREDFVLEDYKAESYKDVALPIGRGQTISQPYTIAFMLSILEISGKNNLKILEIGSGSGYVLALINQISENSQIFGVERVKELAERSQKALKVMKNIKIIHEDGSNGLAEEAEKERFDRILVSAAYKEIPYKLLKQLKTGGILVVPVRNSIVSIKKFPDENKVNEFQGFVFVPLIRE